MSDIEIVRLTYRDNPWCPQVMKDEAARDFERNPEAAASIWDGLLSLDLDEIVFSGVWMVEDFKIEKVIEELKAQIKISYSGLMQERRAKHQRQAEKINNAFLIGYDHGFVDPSAGLEIFLDAKNKKIYCLREMYERRQSLTEIPSRLKAAIPRAGEKWPVQCDSARPDVIALLKDAGIRATSCTKLKIVDRIDALKTYLIIVHPRCENLIRELSSYRYQTDRNGNVLPDPIDADNHLLDSLAYSLGNELQTRKGGYRELKNPYV